MISVIIPFNNEKENIPSLIKGIRKAFNAKNEPYEIVMVDDGSMDGSDQAIPQDDSDIRLIRHKKRLGKGRALSDGYRASTGNSLIFMDADLQDDPSEIPEFLKKLEEGYDFVNGWRKERKDPLGKRLSSAIFNFFLLKLFLKSKFHDINCGFKAMRRAVLEQIPLYGDNYRFLPILAEKNGFKTTEMIVDHHPRVHGASKYGFFRLFSGFIDTLTTYFVYQFAEKPLHFFGPVGTLIFILGSGITLYLVYERVFFGILLYRRPALLLGILLVIVGIQIVMTGFLGELIVYLDKRRKNPIH